MRRFLLKHRWATILVVGLMLFATSGATLSRMTCFSEGHSVLSFGAADDCCPDEASGPGLKAVCCELSQARAGIIAFVPHDMLALAPVLMALDAVPVMVVLEIVSTGTSWLESRPPPLLAPERLASISSFLI